MDGFFCILRRSTAPPINNTATRIKKTTTKPTRQCRIRRQSHGQPQQHRHLQCLPEMGVSRRPSRELSERVSISVSPDTLGTSSSNSVTLALVSRKPDDVAREFVWILQTCPVPFQRRDEKMSCGLRCGRHACSWTARNRCCHSLA